ncbi:uncharacterized protein YdeI (YjbR/CyaY-like superfamily) [Allocatelliglobosispora scoriae]|uniref:Uncharacterized protein YdeI (YjbR/CyaY-like superfamily) n=1 Tax=Allocatelliglobosispora scoriae TaxID=643052 RepID=A0A841C265_9ACTN|nr:YdeI/OmpD-associated family protein [Allocatelliglobosispora scoriae]MBB5874444.1 uncharacterized protein YdeI (YjbR/CyaY-like superfamily) [Allocatelliglobosispora scoriae]
MDTFDTVRQFEDWMAANHDSQAEVWMLIAKKGSGRTTLTIGEALDVALCYGWIDSQRKAHDEDFYLQRYSPRRPKGSWSKVNIAKVEALTAAGRMRAPGLAEVAAAKADGRWEAAYVAQRDATVPPDLETALAAHPAARSAFESLGKTDRYLAILQLLKARTPRTRAVKLEKLITGWELG